MEKIELSRCIAFGLLAVAAICSAFVPFPHDAAGVVTSTGQAAATVAMLFLKPPVAGL